MASLLYDARWIDDTLDRLAAEIAVRRGTGKTKALVGLRTRGAILADRLRDRLSRRRQDVRLPLGYLDATLYRDDLHTGAGLKKIVPTDIPFPLDDCDIVLIDDVISTGRSVRAAISALFDYGRPPASASAPSSTAAAANYRSSRCSWVPAWKCPAAASSA